MSVDIPQEPKDTGFFKPQHGYSDINIKTQSYSNKPTPIKAHNNTASGFISEHTDSAHAKEYGKKGGKKLFDILKGQLIGFLCH
ncbi:uncharacterized protein KGF55_000552 [Candida pseudojiufengensis]|uniref:uncharacterized protein n=1 Tax=Candida pseudojiufengensis TaxID=497109 RepID=UPI00222437BF|nr:uncharacterized protein KGF55_000552 [Candida pseudojiufengensis]KAI5966243.1 hypothetical protein KGF55_000552 [Candida pseudojiufengensis]